MAGSLRDGATVIDPRGEKARLLIENAGAGKYCAACWPSTPGWHRVRSGDATMDWVVRDATQASGLLARGLRDQTLALVPGLAAVCGPLVVAGASSFAQSRKSVAELLECVCCGRAIAWVETPMNWRLRTQRTSHFGKPVAAKVGCVNAGTLDL